MAVRLLSNQFFLFGVVSSLVSFTTAQLVTSTWTKTKVYMNVAEGYSDLPSCAEAQASTIVRDMGYDVCPDGSHETSFSCFCSASSSQVNDLLSNEIQSKCSTRGDQLSADINSVQVVFSRYCQLPIDTEVAVTTMSGPAASSQTPTGFDTSVASPGPSLPSTAAATSSSSSSSPTATAIPGTSSSRGLSRSTTLAIAIPISVGSVIILALVLWTTWYRRHRPRTTDHSPSKHHAFEVDGTLRHERHELPERSVLELASTPIEKVNSSSSEGLVMQKSPTVASPPFVRQPGETGATLGVVPRASNPQMATAEMREMVVSPMNLEFRGGVERAV